MAIVKGTVTLYRSGEPHPLGRGSCVLHLSESPDGRRLLSGTVTALVWAEGQSLGADDRALTVEFDDGRRFHVTLTRRTVGSCSGQEILRFAGSHDG